MCFFDFSGTFHHYLITSTSKKFYYSIQKHTHIWCFFISTPDRYVEVGGSRLNNLSYQLAMQYNVAVRGVFLCEQGGMLRIDTQDLGWIIKTVNTVPVHDLDEVRA